MLQRQEKSPAATKATDQVSGVVRDFLRNEEFPAELMEFAVAQAMRVLGEAGWTSGQVLRHCRALINSDAARAGTATALERREWINAQLRGWLLGCGRQFQDA